MKEKKTILLIAMTSLIAYFAIMFLYPLFGFDSWYFIGDEASIFMIAIFVNIVVIIIFGVLILDKLQAILDELKHH